jgi:phenylacetate-CoA ligase
MHKALVKNILVPLHEKLIGRKTSFFLKELEELQWKSREELEKLKFEKLKKLLLHAKQNVPFYAQRFADAGFNPESMQHIDDFKVLPFLTKSDIRKNLDALKWKACTGGLFRYNTGGSSGDPLVFYFDRRRQGYDAAARALTHRWWGIDIGDKELYLWGSPLEITKQDRLKNIRDRLTNQLLISAFEISEQQIPQMITQIKKFKPQCIFGYPSTIDLFCRMAAKQNFHLNKEGIQVVFSTAEVLYEHQRQSISEYLGGLPVVDGYGSREGGFISHQCRENTHHVMDPNYVIEFIKDGKEARLGEDGEITVTHLDAWGMPFIRYSTGDIAKPGGNSCKCGRGLSTISAIQGRTTDFIVTPDGRWQHALSIIYVVRDIEGVAEFKIIQQDVDDIRVLLKIHDDLYPVDGNERILAGFKKRMGEDVRVKIERVSDIPREASGKHRYVVSKVSQQGFK